MPTPLSQELLIVELGGRLAAAACGTLLSELGATVVAVERDDLPASVSKAPFRSAMLGGKLSLMLPDDADLIASLIARADAVVTSSDVDGTYSPVVQEALTRARLVCDTVGFGAGPLDGKILPDALMQAMTGTMDVAGEPDGPPTPSRAPIMEFTTGIYAAASVLLGLRGGDGLTQQRAAVSVFDCAVSMLTTFLPKYLAGGHPTRIGNHHPSMSPWNAYRAVDGWVMLCSGSDDQWRRVCDVIGRPELAGDPRYARPAGRVGANPDVDAIVEAWTKERSVADCVSALDRASIPCGPVTTVEKLFSEPNLNHRGMVRTIPDDEAGRDLRYPGALFRGSKARGIAAASVPCRGAGRAAARTICDSAPSPKPHVSPNAERGVLAGLRVLEIGQYTTAPLTARQLGAFGADVIKIEPPVGEPARALPPHRDGQSYFFTLSNSDKRGVALDLRNPADQQTFADLISRADILVENMKPGSLARFGFGADRMAAINPRLIYCAISGFGADSPAGGRGAMDTTIQGESGLMDLTRSGDTPYKIGISIVDLIGGQLALLCLLAALDFRDRTGGGQFVDLSMLDAAAWMTRLEWNGVGPSAATVVVCRDGFVAVDASPDAVAQIAATTVRATRDEAVQRLRAAGHAAAPVLSVAEVARHPQTIERGLLQEGVSPTGESWPLLATPMRLSHQPGAVRRAMGPIDVERAKVLADWGMTMAEAV